MSSPVRLIGTGNREIVDLDSWFEYAPPEGGAVQWVDGFSAKEQAKAWLRPGQPAVPSEIEYALGVAGFDEVTQWTGFPEHQTKLDDYGRGDRGWRHHDMLLLLGDPEHPTAVVGIEAKACEDYDGLVSAKAATGPPSRLLERCNLMAQALFGRPVCNSETRSVVDEQLNQHGYQLWTGSVGTVREAQAAGSTDAVFFVHQFAPGALGSVPGDKRDWEKKLAKNAAKLCHFEQALGPSPQTHATEYVRADTRVHVAHACSLIAPADGTAT